MVAHAAPINRRRFILADLWPFRLMEFQVVTDTTGDTSGVQSMRLETGQFYKLLAACIGPALMFGITCGTWAWGMSSRLLVAEKTLSALMEQVKDNQVAITALTSNNLLLTRIDQRNIDFDRRVTELEHRINELRAAVKDRP